MACNYTLGGNLIDCKDNMGGVKEIYIIDYSDIISFTLSGDSTEIVSTITLESLKLFKTYQLRKQSATMDIETNTDDVAGTTFFTTNITFNIPKMKASTRLELNALSLGNVAVIVRDINNKFWLLGYHNPVTLTAGGGATGQNYGDANQYTFTLTDMGNLPPYEVTHSIITSIVDDNISLPLPS